MRNLSNNYQSSEVIVHIQCSQTFGQWLLQWGEIMSVFALLFSHSLAMGIIVFLLFYLHGGVSYLSDLYLIEKLWGL